LAELESLLEMLEGFAIYGADEDDLLDRIARYIGDCRRLAVLGKELGDAMARFCRGFEIIEGDPSIETLRRAVVDMGRSLLFRWRSPVEGVASLVLVLHTKRNIDMLSRGWV